jgi:hypothetical protein
MVQLLGQSQQLVLADGFKYVLGFEPGSKGTFTSVFTAMNAITGASGNNTIENAALLTSLELGSTWNYTTGMELTASALTSGKLLALNSTSQAQTGSILNITASGGASSTGLLAQLKYYFKHFCTKGITTSKHRYRTYNGCSRCSSFAKRSDFSVLVHKTMRTLECISCSSNWYLHKQLLVLQVVLTVEC